MRNAQGLYDPRFEHDACGIGFIADVKGRRSNTIVRHALTALVNLSHRGARGAEADTGDGAGLLLQIPHRFLAAGCAALGIDLPEPGAYGVAMLFMPHDPALRGRYEEQIATIVRQAGQTVLGWRTVPTDNQTLGATARAGEPFIRQLFIARHSSLDEPAFERQLYLIRRRAEKAVGGRRGRGEAVAGVAGKRLEGLYVVSLSCRTIVYKGMLTPEQLEAYYPDLSDPQMESALALFHARFSTNTFPSWERAHPNRYIVHNGEINTLQGNVNWMRAREARMQSPFFGNDLTELFPIIDRDGSDSAMFDNCLEFLVMNGRPLPHAILMMIPEPWSKHEEMEDARRAFYEYHSCLMEPWDGPASIAFTDGRLVGAVLDRNGLRPSRYIITKDDLVVMASEVGVLDIPPDRVLTKGRLQPGRIFLVDTVAGQIIADETLKTILAAQHPYRAWLNEKMLSLEALEPSNLPTSQPVNLPTLHHAFGYTYEDLRLILAPMANNGVEPIGSMGDDTPPAVLSEKPQPLYNYFKQLFAQVTNPPIDAIREELVTSTETHLGSEANLLLPGPNHCRRLKLPTPILDNDDLAQIHLVTLSPCHPVTLPILFPITNDAPGLAVALETLFAAADEAIASGANLLILSDRSIDRDHAAIPALLATAGLHHHLINNGRRTQVSLIVESGEPREVHHFATLLGYGADAINPYLALDTVEALAASSFIRDLTPEEARRRAIKAIVKGVVKIISKMGISTIQSYRGAQIFEALGLHPDVVDRYFTGTPSRIGGAGLDVLAEEVRIRHENAFPPRPSNGQDLTQRRKETETQRDKEKTFAPSHLSDFALNSGGRYQWRHDGEFHLFNPATVHRLQLAVRKNDYRLYQQYAEAVDDRGKTLCTLRGLLELKPAAEPLPLDEVEPVEAILRRFKTGAMSYGSISQEAHETLAIAMNRLGGKSNTGEGGEDPARYRLDANGDSRSSAIKQVASGRFGVTSLYLVNAQEIQIKMAQGAKPGEGGQLPGHKVYPWIAQVRNATPGVGLISPPPHHDIYSIEDLAQLIHDLKNANRGARISVKLVSEVGVGTIAAGVAKGHADVILISGHDGGTGASPQTSIKHAGLPWELGLAETHQTLLLNNLRGRVTLETDGQLKTGRDVVIAALLGAEEFGFATAPLVALGCIMMRVCHLDTCPVGIATQNPELRQKFAGQPEHVENFMRLIAQDVRHWMARLGFRTFDEMVGRVDRLEPRAAVDHWKARGLDLSKILYQPNVPPDAPRTCIEPQDHGLDNALDLRVLLPLCAPALDTGEPLMATLPIRNTNRAVGTILGSEITRRYGADALPEDTIWLHFQGSAGQSFGAFIPRGLTLYLEGDANDYTGKGLSGGKLIVVPPAGSTFAAEENTIIGNVAFYGATAGEAYIHGMAGERFCVRNSGLHAVVEAVGDHACEYMTGGVVVVLGPTGRNFAAGMSGGVAYVLDVDGNFARHCNQEMVSLEPLEETDLSILQEMIERHLTYTNSRRARHLLDAWPQAQSQFVKVLPRDYQRMLQAIARARQAGLDGDEAIMAAFEANKRDMARVSGN